MNHLANTIFPVQTFCNAIFWKFTLGFYHLRFYVWDSIVDNIKGGASHRNMLNVERTKMSNLWLCAFPWTNIIVTQSSWRRAPELHSRSCFGVCGNPPNILHHKPFFFLVPWFNCLKSKFPPLCIICDMWWRYYKFQINDASKSSRKSLIYWLKQTNSLPVS